MPFENEDEILKRLGIESWRNLSKEKLLTFVSDLPNIDPKVALAIVAQFPNFKSLVQESLDQTKDHAENAISMNWKSQKKVHEAFAEYREILSKELDRDDLTADDRFRIIEMLRDALQMEASKDSEHKSFVFKILGTVGVVTVAGSALALALLGGKARIGGGFA